MTPPKRIETDHPDIVAYPNGDRYARITINKHRKEYSLHTRSQREAKENLKNLLRKLDPQTFIKGKIRVIDIWPRFLEEKRRLLKDGERRVRTIEEYESLFERHLLPFFKFTPVDEINKAKWLEYVKTQKIRVKNHRKVFGNFLRWCVDEGHINGIPALPIPKYKVEKGHALTKDQLTKLLNECKTPKLLAFCLMYLYMAMRSREITALEWSRVDFERRVIYLGEENVKTSKERWVPIHDDVLKLLVLMKDGSKSPFVFPMRGHPSRPMCDTGIYRSFNTAKRKAGIDSDISPHDFRHTWNTEAHDNPIFTDAQREKFAGSSSIVQKGVYHHANIERLRPLTEAVKHESLTQIFQNKLDLWGRKRGKSK